MTRVLNPIDNCLIAVRTLTSLSLNIVSRVFQSSIFRGLNLLSQTQGQWGRSSSEHRAMWEMERVFRDERDIHFGHLHVGILQCKNAITIRSEDAELSEHTMW